MKTTRRWQSIFAGALTLAAAVSFVTPIGAQVTSSSAEAGGARALEENLAAQAAQRAATAESILASKEQALGQPFDTTIRAGLKSRMEKLTMEQLAGLAQQGADANIPLALGSVTSDLVYTPVTPCRVFDSRPGQGGPGPIGANTQRTVQVVGAAGFPLQGGFLGGCGIPVGATSVIMNFVAINPAGPGNIRAWAVTPGPAAQLAAPLAAVLNYGVVSGLSAIANGVAVPLCDPAAGTCTSGDLRLQADTSSTDILGDVVGYFRNPTAVPFSLHGCHYVTGPVINGTNGGFNTSTVSCPAGEFAVGSIPTWQGWFFAAACVPATTATALSSTGTRSTSWFSSPSSVGTGCQGNTVATSTLCCP